MGKIILLLLFISAAGLTALEFIPASGDIIPPPARDSLAFYHTNQVDLLWYNTNDSEYSWAVWFNFTDFTPGLDSLVFSIQNLYVYVETEFIDPQMKLKLCEAGENQPGDQLQDEIVIIAQSGWNTIPVPETEIDQVWVLIDFETNSEDSFLAGSWGDGTHSYYIQDEYYYNMSANGYQSEFLVTLEGQFIFDFDDLELDQFQVVDAAGESEFELSEEVFPFLSIVNNSSVLMDSIFLEYEQFWPDTSSTQSAGPYQVSAGQTLTLDQDDMAAYAFELLPDPSQYIFQIELSCPDDQYSLNNSAIYEFNTLELPLERILVENAVQVDELSLELWSAQQELIVTDSAFVINFFPYFADEPFYNISALQRFSYYELGLYPVTVIGGTEFIFGYIPDLYEARFSQAYSDYSDLVRSYLLIDDLVYFWDLETNQINVDFTLKNPGTHIFQDYLQESTVYTAVVEDSLELRDDIFGTVLLNTIDQFSCDDLYYGNSDSLEIGFILDQDLIPVEEFEDCRFVYWVQNDQSRQVDFIHVSPYVRDIEFQTVDTDQNDLVSHGFTLYFYPNPVSGEKPFNISVTAERGVESIGLDIYNIRGQMVRSLDFGLEQRSALLQWDGRDSRGQTVASGIYLIRAQARGSSSYLPVYSKFVKISD